MIPPLKPQHSIFAPLAEFGVVFVLTPKVASSAIVDAISRRYAANLRRPYHGNTVFPWMTLDQVNASVPDWPRIMFVRNPYDRLVGCFEFHIRDTNVQMSRTMRELGFHAGMNFDQFLALVCKNTEADAHFAMQCWQSDRVDFLGHFEVLAEDWQRMRETLGIDLPDLKVVNRSGRHAPDFRDYYSADQEKRIAAVYEQDFAAYGYGFEPV